MFSATFASHSAPGQNLDAGAYERVPSPPFVKIVKLNPRNRGFPAWTGLCCRYLGLFEMDRYRIM